MSICPRQRRRDSEMEGLAHDKKWRLKEKERGDGNETEREKSPALGGWGGGVRCPEATEEDWRKAGRLSGTPCGVSVSDSSALP